MPAAHPDLAHVARIEERHRLGRREHHVTEALWMHQYHNVVDVELLKRVLASSSPVKPCFEW